MRSVEEHLREIQKITQYYPRFADGRIDYTNARVCPVVNCTVFCGDEVLLTFRSKEVIAYPETWNGISGFIDELKPIEEIVHIELAEEVGILAQHVQKLTILDKIVQTDEAIGREWHVFPVGVWLYEKVEVTTNWESKQAQWLSRHEVLEHDLLPGYKECFEKLCQV